MCHTSSFLLSLSSERNLSILLQEHPQHCILHVCVHVYVFDRAATIAMSESCMLPTGILAKMGFLRPIRPPTHHIPKHLRSVM